MTTVLEASIKTWHNPNRQKLEELGVEVGKLYTDHGLPVDMALERIECSKDDKICILGGVGSWLVQHRRNSGATEKAIERQRKQNVAMIESFIRGNETGIY